MTFLGYFKNTSSLFVDYIKNTSINNVILSNTIISKIIILYNTHFNGNDLLQSLNYLKFHYQFGHIGIAVDIQFFSYPVATNFDPSNRDIH